MTGWEIEKNKNKYKIVALLQSNSESSFAWYIFVTLCQNFQHLNYYFTLNASQLFIQIVF